MREFGDQGAENERVETWRAEQECRVQKGITVSYRTLDSAVNFGPGNFEPTERHTGVPHASREPAGRQQWAESCSVGSCA